MELRVIRGMLARPWLRIGLAAALVIGGLAPVGLPIMSGASRPYAAASDGNAAQSFVYRWGNEADGTTRVERSDDGASTWHRVAAIPQPVSELQAVRGLENLAFARSTDTVWVSEDGGETWAQAAALPSRPQALAVSSTAPGTLFIGTESMGLLRSNDRGASWQVVNSPELILGGAGALSVTALAIHPDDEQVMVAATGVWLGSTSAQLAPLGIFVSADGGREWFMAARAPLGAPVVNSLRPAAGSPATFVVETADGSHTLQVALNADLLSALDAASPARRAAAARIIGLTGDAAALPALTARLEDSDPLAGDRIVEAATRLGGNEVSGSLRALLASDDEALQARAAYGLGLLKDDASVTALGATLAHGGPMAARRAAEALAAIGTSEAVAKLIEPLAIPEMTPARHAAQAGLEQAGRPAVEPLAAALTSNDPIMRTHAAEALGWLKPIAATEALATALSDPDRNVRTEAAWALGELATGEARTALAKAIRSEDEATRSAAEAALARADRLTGNGAEMKPGGALLATLAQAGTARWTLLGLTLALAAALVFARPVAQMRLHGR